jgi:hypothetical protein
VGRTEGCGPSTEVGGSGEKGRECRVNAVSTFVPHFPTAVQKGGRGRRPFKGEGMETNPEGGRVV